MKRFGLAAILLMLSLSGCFRYEGPYFTRPTSPNWQEQALTQHDILSDSAPASPQSSNEDLIPSISENNQNQPYQTIAMVIHTDRLDIAPMAEADAMVHFDVGQDLPKEELMQNLNAIGQYLATNPFSTALIQGHADSTGQAAANVQLSRRRAESIKQYLMLHWNIAPERLEIEALGDSVPLADNATAQGRAMNRRVELFLRDPLPGPAIAQAAVHPALLREQLHFASNAVQPQNVDTQTLERIQTFLDANPQAVVLIQGHSDGMGDAARNYALSEQRAQNVMLTLNQRFNIPMQRMRTVAHGEGAPLATNDTDLGRIMNRRVEVTCGPADAIGWDAALLL